MSLKTKAEQFINEYEQLVDKYGLLIKYENGQYKVGHVLESTSIYFKDRIINNQLPQLKETYGKKFATVQRCAIIAKYLKVN